MDDYVFKQPPILNLQLWDNDFISADDFIGSLEINLSSFPEPSESAKKCELPDVTQSVTSYGSTITKLLKSKSQRKLINLFKNKKVHGWFGMRGNVKDAKQSGKVGLAGKIELEMEVLTKDEAMLDPAGLGRDGPHMLEQPKRPKTSFNPFTSPLKGLKHILLPQLLKYIVIILILLIICYKLFQLLSKISFLGFLGYK